MHPELLKKEKKSASENRNQKEAIKFVERFYYSNCVNLAHLKEGKQGKYMILVDAQRTEIPHTHRHR